MNKFLRYIDNTHSKTPLWKSNRGYMLVENIKESEEGSGNMVLEGYLKGNCIHANQLVHITGFDDYEIEKI